MKNYFKNIAAAVFGILTFAACSPEEFDGANGQIPTLENIEPVITVDQEINQVTFSLPEGTKGCMPLWLFYENKGTDKEKVTYSTVNGMKRIFAKAGDYEVGLKLMNRNGISDGEVLKTFHIDNTIMNFDKYLTQLCGGTSNSTKEWRIDNSKGAHLGCGPSGSTGTEWWSAGPDEKAAFGVYDNRMTFGSDYSYTFNPGEAGTIYVNKDVTGLGGPKDEDFCVAASEQTVEFEFDVDGDDLYIVFPAHTNFPYIANDDIWNTPRYRVESITPAEINLVSDNGGIAWHYILTSGAAAVKFNGFKYDSPFNLWKQVDDNDAFETSFWYAPGWNQIADPGFEKNGGAYTFSLPEATTDQWQAQCFIIPEALNLEADKSYDVSMIINASNDVKGITLKLTDKEDDGNFLFTERVDVKAFEDMIFYLSDINGLTVNADCKMVFDFGGNPANTEITIKNIVIKDHANDDGTVLPSDEEGPAEGGVVWADPESAANLMNSGTLSLASCWWADNNWNQIAEPEVNVDGKNVTITAVEANGGSQWQGQVHLNTQVAIEEGKAYDFSITFNASQDLGGATVKPHPEGDDGHFFSEGRHDIASFMDVTVTYENFVADFSTGNLVITLDFPGCEAGTVIEVKNIIIQEHNEASAGGSWAGVDSEDNLMTSGNFSLASCWWADNNWTQQDDPTVDIDGRTATITANVASGGSQWQGQVHFNTGVAIEEGETYDFSITFNASQNLGGATVKPHPEGDDGHFFSEARHDIAAYEDVKVTYTEFTADFSTGNLVITLDFPGCEAGTVIEVKDIIIQKHK